MRGLASNDGTRATGGLARIFAFLGDERGDDLVEYALLTTVIGLVGVTAFNFLWTAIANAYSSWDSAQQALAPSPNPQVP